MDADEVNHKPCPSCHRNDLICLDWFLYQDSLSMKVVQCEWCGYLGKGGKTEQEAWEAWDRRVV